MKKIKLDVNDLRVGSFETASTEAGWGTVQGRQISPTLQISCNFNYSAYNTCVVACECTNRYMRCKDPDYSSFC